MSTTNIDALPLPELAAEANRLEVFAVPPPPMALPFGHPYGEHIWLPYLGPLHYVTARHLMRRALANPTGEVLYRAELAQACGVKGGSGSPIRHALRRLTRLGLIRPDQTSRDTAIALGVVVRWPLLTPSRSRRLPPGARRFHDETLAEIADLPSGGRSGVRR